MEKKSCTHSSMQICERCASKQEMLYKENQNIKGNYWEPHSQTTTTNPYGAKSSITTKMTPPPSPKKMPSSKSYSSEMQKKIDAILEQIFIYSETAMGSTQDDAQALGRGLQSIINQFSSNPKIKRDLSSKDNLTKIARILIDTEDNHAAQTYEVQVEDVELPCTPEHARATAEAEVHIKLYKKYADTLKRIEDRLKEESDQGYVTVSVSDLIDVLYEGDYATWLTQFTKVNA